MECILEKITVNYETYGEGKPLLFLPGWGMNARIMAHDMEPCFDPQAGWNRIYIDPPGHGKTPGADWITNQDDILDVVLDCIDTITEGRNYCLVGQSLGAYLARGVLLRRTKSVEGIAMLAPVIFAEDPKRTVPAHTVLIKDPTVYKELTPIEAEIFGISVVHSRTWLETLRNSPQIPDEENGDPEFLNKIREDLKKYAFSFDVDALPKPFPGPSLIIAGRQDGIVGYRDAWGILEMYPRASFVVLDRAGHPLEDSETLVYMLINQWLDRVEENIGIAQ